MTVVGLLVNMLRMFPQHMLAYNKVYFDSSLALVTRYFQFLPLALGFAPHQYVVNVPPILCVQFLGRI